MKLPHELIAANLIKKLNALGYQVACLIILSLLIL